MKKTLSCLLGVSSIALAMASPAMAADQPANASASSEERGIADIIVTARREAESIQSVPVAVSAISSEHLSKLGTFRPEDISQTAPGLAVSGGGDTDRGNLIFSIRGQNYTYGASFPSVITYFNDVPTKYLSVGQFFDMDSLQVLRGPQGVQFGRVTNGGNVMFTPKRPTQKLSADIALKGGNYGMFGTTGNANIPLSDTLAVRLAWDVARRNGFTHNLYNDKDLDNVNYKGGRLGILWQPTSRFENYLVAQYQYSEDNGTGIILENFNPVGVAGSVANLYPLVNLASELGMRAPVYGINPQTGAIGAFGANGNTLALNTANLLTSTQNYINRQKALGPRQVYSITPNFNERKYLYVVNTSKFQVTDNIDAKLILGYTRYIERSAQNFFGDNGGIVQPCHSGCPFQPGNNIPFKNDEQLSAEFRLSGKSFDNRLTWSLGGYMDKQQPGGAVENDTIFGGILEYLVEQRPTTKSRAVYGYGEFDVTDKWKVNAGVRYTHDTIRAFNTNYNALLPVPGLEAMVLANATLFRSFGAPGFAGLTDAQLAGFAAATANSAAAVPHGQCANYSAGAFNSICDPTDGVFNSTTWTFGTSYQIAPRQLVYIKYSKGYRPGGVNATFPAGFANLRSFKPENNFSLEAGIKADYNLGSVPVRTNLAVFKDRYKNIQSAIQIRDVNGNPGSIVTNVAAANIWGIEFEGSIRPFPGLSIGANYSYTHAKYGLGDIKPSEVNTKGTLSYDACNGDAAFNFGFCTLQDFPITPTHQAGANFQWDFVRDEGGLGTIGIGGNWYYQSRFASNTGKSFLRPQFSYAPSYSTFNLSANWNNIKNSHVDLLLYVTNVTDEIHVVTFNSLMETANIGNLNYVYSAPRMFGATVTAHF